MLKEVIQLDDGDQSQAIPRLLRKFSKRYLLIGSGPRLQYADPERAVTAVLDVLRDATLERTLLIFGGDSADETRPDLGYLMLRVKSALAGKAEVLSLQSWPALCPFADYTFIYPREWSQCHPPKELWGGTLDGEPVAATRYYLSAEVRSLLNMVLCIGGGEIAKQELAYALSQRDVPHRYIKAEARYPRGESCYGPAHDWYLSRTHRHETGSSRS